MPHLKWHVAVKGCCVVTSCICLVGGNLLRPAYGRDLRDWAHDHVLYEWADGRDVFKVTYEGRLLSYRLHPDTVTKLLAIQHALLGAFP